MIKTKSFILSSIVTIFTVFILSSSSALALVPPECSNSFFGLPPWYQYLNIEPTNCSIVPGQSNVPVLVILGVIAIAIRLAGILAVFMIIWGGYKFIFSDGNSDQVAGARKTILNAVIGLIIVILATPLVNFIASRLSS